MIKFSPEQKTAVEEADRLATLLAHEYAERTRDSYKEILSRIHLGQNIKGRLPSRTVSVGIEDGAELKLEWHDARSPDDISGKAKVRVLFNNQPVTEPRFLTQKKLAIRQDFLASWPELAGALGDLGEVVAQKRGETGKVEQAQHQSKLDLQWTDWREDRVAQSPKVVALKDALAREEAETRQELEGERERWEYVADEREL